MKMKALSVIVAIMVLALFSIVVFADPDPQGPTDLGAATPERREVVDTTTGKLEQADAGNMTSLNINSTTISNRWQGYYGNITGTITLDDAGNNTLYSWVIASPQGEIYAVNSSTTPTWSSVVCFNFSKTSSEQNITLSNLENALGMNPSDDDTVNKTFNLTFTNSFTIGSSNTIQQGDGCQLASLYVDDDYDELNFNETILTDNSTTIIYVSLLEQTQQGFSSANLDFQMIVGENGDVTAATNYYFYIELT